jgi:SAM-dependent methyltransferase
MNGPTTSGAAESAKSLASSVQANGWPLSEADMETFDADTRYYIGLELADGPRTFDAYASRIAYLGLEGAGRVLDYGCGIGHWVAALAKSNMDVVGVDKSEMRLNVARKLCSGLGARNTSFRNSLENLEPGSFDAIICYSVFMFVDGRETMAMFHRMLRPGGKLYVMVDLPAWHLRTLLRRPAQLPFVAYTFIATALGAKRNIVYTRRTLPRLLESAGFKCIDQGNDGEASFLPAEQRPETPPAFLPGRFWRLQTLFEVCAVRS